MDSEGTVIHRRKHADNINNKSNGLTKISDDKIAKTAEKKEHISWAQYLSEPTDCSRLVVFRVLFGICMAWHIVRAMEQGVIDANFNEMFPEVNFHFYFAQGLVTPSRLIVQSVFYICVVSAVFLLLGFCYRISSLSFLVTFSYINMLEKARYNNHYYFYILLAFLFLMTDCHKRYSVDSLIKSYFKRNTNDERFVPNWQICLFRFQVFVCYFYAGIAKMNKDWLLRGEPCQTWFYRKPEFRLVAEYIVGEDNAANFLGYNFCMGGFLFDLTVGFLLLTHKFRSFGFMLTTLFHLTNHFAFSIGTFPWTMLATNVLFLDGDTLSNTATKIGITLERLLAVFTKTKRNKHVSERKDSKNKTIQNTEQHNKNNNQRANPNKEIPADRSQQGNPIKEKDHKDLKTMHTIPKLKMAVLVCYVLVQIFVPYRHWLYPGDVNWTMEGHQFSWRMMLNDEDVLLRILVKPRKDMAEFVHDDYQINARQLKRMLTDPELVLQYTQHLSTRLQQGEELANVRVDMWRSLNKRPFQRWIDPSVNLAAESYTLFSYTWLEEQISDEHISFSQIQEISKYWEQQDKEVSFFIQRPGEVWKTFLRPGHCSNITVLPVTRDIQVTIKKIDYNISVGTEHSLPLGKFHYIQTLGESPAVWAYVHDCPKAMFHLTIMMVSLDSWQIM